MLKAAVVGYGSIGERHALWLKKLGCQVAVVSARAIDYPRKFSKLKDCLKEHRPQYVVIANATAQHEETLKVLTRNGFRGKVLIEKPLFKNFKMLEIPRGIQCFTAYNLRFHPLLQRVKKLIQGKKVIQVQANVGKYLPEWRPGKKFAIQVVKN